MCDAHTASCTCNCCAHVMVNAFMCLVIRYVASRSRFRFTSPLWLSHHRSPLFRPHPRRCCCHSLALTTHIHIHIDSDIRCRSGRGEECDGYETVSGDTCGEWDTGQCEAYTHVEMGWHVMRCHVMSCHVMPCHVMWM